MCALAPKKPMAAPISKKLAKVEDQLDDIFDEAASGSLYSEGSWDESESSSELLAELEALELEEVAGKAEFDVWVSGFYSETVSCAVSCM